MICVSTFRKLTFSPSLTGREIQFEKSKIFLMKCVGKGFPRPGGWTRSQFISGCFAPLGFAVPRQVARKSERGDSLKGGVSPCVYMPPFNKEFSKIKIYLK